MQPPDTATLFIIQKIERIVKILPFKILGTLRFPETPQLPRGFRGPGRICGTKDRRKIIFSGAARFGGAEGGAYFLRRASRRAKAGSAGGAAPSSAVKFGGLAKQFLTETAGGPVYNGEESDGERFR
ncbi:MAG TPA: hypothetical protein DCL64_04390 [Ruminococcaceae bacterium]|nr:hypothetical protein [Oscillospiraceae bacterium]